MKNHGAAFVAVVAALFMGCAAAEAPPSPSSSASSAPAASTAAAQGGGPGPAVGEQLPPFEAPDQDGRRQGFETLRGKNGLLLNFNRSVVW
jgi:cytochrome oxidase Cu insertion factor (SCO1/SenC/PrrC family)